MAKLKGNCIIAQSGGPTAVINSSICGVIQEARAHKEIKGIYGAINGILGIINEEIVDIRKEKKSTIGLLRKTPSSALGSCRYKLKDTDYERVFEVLKAHNVRYFFMNGGNDSMDTAYKISKIAESYNYEMRVIGVPKTIDNDLAYTDHCPGYGSVSRWLAIAVRDAGRDTDAIYTTDTVKIIETMGRNAGWITAATAMAKQYEDEAPHLIYLPEKPFKKDKFLQDVENVYRKYKRVVITVCEGLRDEKGNYLSISEKSVDVDSFGHKQLGGVSDYLSNLVTSELKIKARYDKPGTIQRMSILCASDVDLKEAYKVGVKAVQFAVEKEISNQMVTLLRCPKGEYKVSYGYVPLEAVANAEKKVPEEYINVEGNFVTQDFIDYVKPLVGGPLPKYARLKKVFLPKLVSIH